MAEKYGNTDQRVVFAEFELDLTNRRLLRSGVPVELYSKTFDLLSYLADSDGRIVSKDELLEAVWPCQIVEEANLAVQISKLRKALGDKTRSPRFLVTVPGTGYKFVAEVSRPAAKEKVASPGFENSQEIYFEKQGYRRDVIREHIVIDDREPGLASRWNASATYMRNAAVAVLAVALAGSGIAAAIYYYGLPTLSRGMVATSSDSRPRIRQLTTKGAVGVVALSPDGQFFAYTLATQGVASNSIWVSPVNGGREVEVRPSGDGNVNDIAFSPEGNILYFTLRSDSPTRSGLFSMPVLGGVEQRLSGHISGRFALSPDGKYLAYYRRDGSAAETSVLTSMLDGTNETVIAKRPFDRAFSSRAPAWSPDGKLMAVSAIDDTFTQSQEIFVIDLADQRLAPLTNQQWAAAQTLVWERSGQGIFAIGADRSETVQQVWHIAYPSGRVERLSNDTDSYGSGLAASAKGNSLIAVQIRRDANVWVSPSDDHSRLSQITFSSINGMYGKYGLDVAADGKVYFIAGVDKNSAVFSMDSDGSNIRQITSPGFFDRRLHVVPEWDRIVFDSNRSGATEVWSCRTDGTELIQLTSGGGNFDAHPTPDGKWVVYTSRTNGQNRLWKIPLDGGQAVRVTDFESSEPTLSPDGTLIACRFENESDARERLAIVRIDNGSLVRSFTLPKTANLSGTNRWTPDARFVAYRDWANGIWLQGIDGGAPTRLEGIPKEKVFSFAWSTDGKRFAISRGGETSDAVLFVLPGGQTN